MKMDEAVKAKVEKKVIGKAMTNEERLKALKQMKQAILSPTFRTSIPQRQEWLIQVVPLLNFNSHYYSNAIPIADILSRPDFSTSMYEHSFARLQSLVGQAIAELEQNSTQAAGLPNIRKARKTQLAAWPVISSLLFDIATSDNVCSIAGIAGLEVDWTLSGAEAFSHLTRNRAYRPKVEAAYMSLDATDQATVVSIIAAELGKRYPQQLETIRSTLARVGWTIKTTPEVPAGADQQSPIMKRDKELQKLLLLQVRDGQEPPQLSQYSEADQDSELYHEDVAFLAAREVARGFVNRGDFTVGEIGGVEARRVLRILVEPKADGVLCFRVGHNNSSSGT